jgi:hypothetical protein
MSKEEQEAERIINLFWDDFCPKDNYPNNNFCDCNSLTQSQAIQCAIIHVEGIIKEINKYSNSDLADIQGWQEVLTILRNK